MVEIVAKVHSIDGLDHPIPTVGMVSYLIEEGPRDYTLMTHVLLVVFQRLSPICRMQVLISKT